MRQVKSDICEYLKSDEYVDWENESILHEAMRLNAASSDSIDYIKRAYEFVRDKISHSWDAQNKAVTISASEVLREKTGICWAKANLLAALLRANKIPSGICYQKLLLGDTLDTGYCIHALNAVFIKPLAKWIRLDARGNKDDVNAQFSLEQEFLAFPVRENLGEVDYEEIHAAPAAITIEILQRNTDALYMYLHDLPDRL